MDGVDVVAGGEVLAVADEGDDVCAGALVAAGLLVAPLPRRPALGCWETLWAAGDAATGVSCSTA